MANLYRVGLALLMVSGVFAAEPIQGNADRGAKLFQNEQCVRCHSVNGKGGTAAPDLARRMDRDYTPAVMASLMWNHAPEMWTGMKAQGIVRPSLSAESAADLFAYFVAGRYFEKPGDAGRGKLAFHDKHCDSCHGIDAAMAGGAPPVSRWESLADPIVLAQQMWNHGGRMHQAFAQKKLAWSQLTGAELYSIHCNRCHAERYPTERTGAQWKTIMLHMQVRANLPAGQSNLILQYLQENSGR